jgi:threonine dehydrogenase-like Zn-dependent dehydrogenase
MADVVVSAFDGPGARPRLERVARPPVPPRAALIRIEACGVCGTDLHILKGHWPRPLPWPITLGHELAGVVEEIGPELSEDFMGQPLAVGDRVMLPPLMPCGQCYYCVHYPAQANKCLNPTYYGRYIPFAKPPHLWGGWAEMVYVDLDMFPATKIYRLPDGMTSMLGSLTEPLAACVRALNRAVRHPGAADGFRVGDTVVVQGSGPIGLLALVAAREMGAGRVVVVGAPDEPRLRICRAFGAAATVSLEDHPTPEARIAAVRAAVGGFGADVVVEASGHPSAGPEGIEMLRDGGTYVEMGQFTDAGPVATNWHRICTKDVTIVGSWGFTGNDIPLGIALLERAAQRYPWELVQSVYPLTQDGIAQAVADAGAMRTLKATICP